MSPEDQDKRESSADFTPAVETEAVSPETEIAKLQEALRQQEAAAKDNYDRYLRVAADLENFKKRTQRERTEAVRFAQEPLIRDLIPVVDNLERAVSHAQDGGNGQPLIEGVGLVLRSFLEVLERHGVSRIEAQGELFDPSKHEALLCVERPDAQPNQVVEQHQPGYFLHDRLLRPAQVSVSALPAKPLESDENDD